jgi:hypothetical protein
VYVDVGRLPEIAPAFAATPVGVVFDHFGSQGRRRRRWITFASVARSRRSSVREAFGARLAGRIRPAPPRAGSGRGARNLLWEATGLGNFETVQDYGHLRAMLEDWTPATLRRDPLG